MTTKLKIYLDTSVVSAYFDDRDISRQKFTLALWQKLPEYEAHICEVVIREINFTANISRRTGMIKLIENLSLLAWKVEMEELAWNYVNSKVFTFSMLDDARHVAACSVANIPILLSWNFRHLVNRRRRNLVNLVNLENGYQEIEIIAPPELS